VTKPLAWLAGVATVATLLMLAWWGWQRVGLGALQLGMTC